MKVNTRATGLIATFDSLCNNLTTIVFKDDPEVVNLMQEVRRCFVSTASFAHEYDYNGIYGNGFWSSLRSTLLLLEALPLETKPRSSLALDFKVLIEYINSLNKLLEEHRILSTTGEGSERCLTISNRSLLLKWFKLYCDSRGNKAIAAMVRSFPGFTIPSEVGRLVKAFYATLGLFGGRADWGLFKWLTSSNVRTGRTTSNLISMDEGLLTKMLSITNYRLLTNGNNLLFWGRPLACRSVYVCPPTVWKIKEKADQNNCALEKLTCPSEGKVMRCRLLKRTSSTIEPETRALVIHVHGGGFVACSPEAHEIYLREWALRLPDAAILVPDYTLCPKARFPTNLQEFLDLYLWASNTNDPNVRPTLGFRPNGIVLSGDSAGSAVAITLALALNDIRRQENVQMPRAVLAVYPLVEGDHKVSPSLLYSALDPFITPPVMAQILSVAYPQMEPCEEGPRLEHKSSDETDTMIAVEPGTEPPQIPWQLQSDREKEALLDHVDHHRGHPYLFVLNYGHFETLSDVSLYLFPYQCCPLLDGSVELAKRWRGPVNFHPIEDVFHSSLNCGFFVAKNEAIHEQITAAFKHSFEH